MDPLKPLIDSLHSDGRLRVWSLVITVLGDAVEPRGGRIATARLQRLMERMGVEPGAMRTALSRLAADGWVIRDREGRNSFYRLSPRGQTETISAAARIYAPPRARHDGDWLIAVGGSAAADPDGIALAPGVRLFRADAAPRLDGDVAVRGRLVLGQGGADGVKLSEPHQNALTAILADTQAMTASALDPLSAMATRCLLIHRWRRIVLLFPDLPPELLPAPYSGTDPRTSVATLYLQLLDPSEEWLSDGDAAFPAMPQAAAHLWKRFREKQKGGS